MISSPQFIPRPPGAEKVKPAAVWNDAAMIIREMKAEDVAPVVHGMPMLKYRPERHERYEEYGVNENGDKLYIKRIFVDEKSYYMYCSACNKRLCSRFINYCPNCGAKMDAEE